MNVAGATLVGGGAAATFGGYVAAGAANRPALNWISVAGLAVAAAGVAMVATNDDPFRWAVDRYNEEARRQGPCAGSAPEPEPSEGSGKGAQP